MKIKLHQLLIALILAAAVLTTVINCGGEKKQEYAADAEKLLPESFADLDLERSPEIREFDEQALWEYINGGAEIYLVYNFTNVITADYTKNDIEIVADIYHFKTSDDAYGMYATLRPPDATTLLMGVEGFSAPASLHFVKGEHLVQLTGDPDVEGCDAAMINLAERLAKNITGTTDKPAMFSRFPEQNKVELTDKYYSESFLGQKFLTGVYSQDYRLDEDSVTIFIAKDEMGKKFLEWSEFVDKLGGKKTVPKDLSFNESYGLIYDDSFYGQIIGGLRSGHLIGIVGYKEELKGFLKDWLESIE